MLNDWSGLGRLVRDPEMRRTGSGIAVCNFTLAVDDDFKTQDGEKSTDFVECTAWRQTAEFVGKHLRKGSMTCVKGRLKSEKWTDKEGKTRTKWFIRCENVYFAESRRDTGANQGRSFGGAESGGYSAPAPAATYGGYTAPGVGVQPDFGDVDYALLDDDDGQLPF